MIKKTRIHILLCIYLMLATLIVGSCSKNKTVSNISFIQTQNAFNEKHYLWVQENFNPELEAPVNQRKAHLIKARSWIRSVNKNFSEAIHHYRIALSFDNTNQQIIQELLTTYSNVGMWDSIEQLVNESNDTLFNAHLWLEFDPDKTLPFLKNIPENERNEHYHYTAASYYQYLESAEKSHYHAHLADQKGLLEADNYYINYLSLINLNKPKEADRAISIFNLLKSLKNEHEPKKLLSIVNDLINHNPAFKNNTGFQILRIRIHLANRNFDQAIELLELVLQKDVDSKLIHELLQAIINSGQDEVAAKIINSLDEEKSNVDIDFLRCRLAYNTDNINNAINLCENVIDKNPWHAKPYHMLALCFLKVDQNSSAINALETAINYAPWHNKWRVLLAQTYLTEGKIELAKKVLNEAGEDHKKIIMTFKQKNGL